MKSIIFVALLALVASATAQSYLGDARYECAHAVNQPINFVQNGQFLFGGCQVACDVQGRNYQVTVREGLTCLDGGNKVCRAGQCVVSTGPVYPPVNPPVVPPSGGYVQAAPLSITVQKAKVPNDRGLFKGDVKPYVQVYANTTFNTWNKIGETQPITNKEPVWNTGFRINEPVSPATNLRFDVLDYHKSSKKSDLIASVFANVQDVINRGLNGKSLRIYLPHKKANHYYLDVSIFWG